MALKYKVQQGDTLNKIASQFGFDNYKKAGISSVPSGNFDLIRPGEEITLGNVQGGGDVSPIKTTPPALGSTDLDVSFRGGASIAGAGGNGGAGGNVNMNGTNGSASSGGGTGGTAGTSDGSSNGGGGGGGGGASLIVQNKWFA